ncbi:MAG: ATP-binding protein [Anaerolineae bacterium]|nr:ATP-binding protein [Anaerolineae bacterium]
MNTPIALTIPPWRDSELIYARVHKDAGDFGSMQFVRIPERSGGGIGLLGRVIRVEYGHDFASEQAVSLVAKKCLDRGIEPVAAKNMVYERLVIEPLGVVLSDGTLSEYRGGVGFFEPVYPAEESEIAALYPETSDGIRIGKVASGYNETNVSFSLPSTRHIAIFGKNGTGKTNLLKEVVASNLEREKPVPMLVFGHPDLALDNPNDGGTRGLLSLNDDRIVAYGYDKKPKLSPEELTLTDIAEQFDLSTAMRDLWRYVMSREPRKYIDILAGYDSNADPLKIRRRKVEDPKDKNKTITIGVAVDATIDAVSKQARILSHYVDSSAPPLVGKILTDSALGKTVLVDTFGMSDYYQGLFVKIVLERMQRLGKRAAHQRRKRLFCVVIDEAQHFIRTAGDKVAHFIQECRKFGITLILATQSPSYLTAGVFGQVHTVMSFHLNRPDLRLLCEQAPLLADCRSIILRPPLKKTLGLGIVQAYGYPYPAVIKVPRFERRFDNTGGEKNDGR